VSALFCLVSGCIILHVSWDYPSFVNTYAH
jgi:hypothetical protein